MNDQGLSWERTGHPDAPGGEIAVLCVPEQFRGSDEVPEDTMPIVRELSELRSGAVETVLPPPGVKGRRRAVRALSPEKLQTAVQALCARYGPLAEPQMFVTVDGRTVRGEPLARWSEEGRLIERAILLLISLGLFKRRRKLRWWESLMADPTNELQLFENHVEPKLNWIRDSQIEDSKVRRERERYEEQRIREKHRQTTRASAARELRDLVNAGLDRSGVRLAVTGDTAPLEIQHIAPTLLGRLWLRVAVASTAHATIRECRICGKLLSPTAGRKLRSDRETCSPRCRQQFLRKRKNKAPGQSTVKTKERRDAASAKRA